MEQKSHVAILPSPGMGHFIPMVEFSKRLILQHNFYVTLIVPDPGHHFNHELETILESLPRGRMECILLPQPNFDDFESHLEFKVRSVFTVARSLPSIRDVIKSLVAKTANLAALVVDLFGTEAFDVANEFNVPAYMFFPSNATALSLFLHLPEIDATLSCQCQYKDLPQTFQIPGCNFPLRGKDFPEPIQDRQSISHKLFLSTVKRYTMAQGIILNSFVEMEAGVIEALQEKQLIEMPPLYTVGPFVRSNSTNASDEVEDLEYSAMMKWLDDQPPGSILFICFGTIGSLSHAQLIELAFGLEMSEKGFLWVVRNSNEQTTSNPKYDQPDLTFLPEGFIERTNSRGFLMSNWAPQARVLRHGSTGGFLTHCGWNSVLESVLNGIPMIAWPLVSEQKMNAALLSEALKVALRPETNNEDGLVGRVAIAKTIKNLMEGEKRMQLEKRMRELKNAAANVLSEDGSSTKSLANLACKWKKI